MFGSRSLVGCLLIALLGQFGRTENITNATGATRTDLSDQDAVKVREIPAKAKMINGTLEANTVHVLHMGLNQSDILDLMRVAVEVVDPSLYRKETDTILEVTVSNGRDNFILKLPVVYPNLTIYSDGKLLNPLLQEDFGPRRKRKMNKNTAVNQNLIVTVQSRLNVDIDYRLHLTRLDRSQYDLKFKPGQSSKTLNNQRLTFVKPMGFFLDGQEQSIKSFHITVTSDDDICANLITVPANVSIYDRRVDSDISDYRRVLTFTQRADIFFSETEIEMFKSFRIFAFISPVDSACSSNTSRKSFNQNKKITFEFTKLEPSSYFFPTLVMFAFFATPFLLFLPNLVLTAIRNREPTISHSNLISFSPEGTLERDVQAQINTNNVETMVIPEEENLQIVETTTSAERPDSLSLHGQMLQYPVAIILPVLMHTAVEFHKWTQSTMANRDEMCFHNNACARPYGELRAWNNIISNIGYAIYGIVFVMVTMCRRRRHLSHVFGTYECTLLDVTVGVFMVLQAIASGTYHICPSDVAFQFDTPCIQVICGLLMIRQWLVRQESPTPAYTNILLFGVVSLNFLISAFSKVSYVRYLIAVVQISSVAMICLAKQKTLNNRKRIARTFIIYFAGGNFVTILAYLTSSTIHLNQIVTYCSIINCIMYLTYYAFMKIVHEDHEKIALKAKVCGALAVIGWAIAASFFFQDDTDWTRTAAASRALNKPCLLFDFFGSHDLWHMFGALAGLFTFLFVSFVDDDLANIPKASINVY